MSATFAKRLTRGLVVFACAQLCLSLLLDPLHVHVAASAAATETSPHRTCAQLIQERYPRQYVAYETTAEHPAPRMDGRLDEPFWEAVPSTTDYVDISTKTLPKFMTRAKIRWDRDWIYVGGYVQDPAVWANITYTCHCYDPKENQVIFDDNDFEVFFDVDGTCHHYKEYEMNAANQNWDLCLNAPYENGGYENSTRVFGKHGFDMKPPLRSAVYIDGVLNDPASKPTFWSVEIMFPVAKLVYNTTYEGTAKAKPRDKDFWRINFSRVEWAVDIVNNTYQKEPACQSCPVPGTATCDNWVWSPMHAIDMHHPELWGFLQFSSDAPNSTAPIYNVEWPARYVAHELYYAQTAFANTYGGVYATNVTALLPFVSHNVSLDEECTGPILIYVSSEPNAFIAFIPSNTEPVGVTVTQDRFILAHWFNTTSEMSAFASNAARVASAGRPPQQARTVGAALG